MIWFHDLVSRFGNGIRPSSAKPEPSPLLLLSPLRSSLRNPIDRLSIIDLPAPTRILDIVERHVQEQRLDGYGLHPGRVRDQFRQIDSLGRVFVQPLNQLRDRVVGFIGRCGMDVVEVDEGAVLGDESLEEGMEGGGLGWGDVEVWRLGFVG